MGGGGGPRGGVGLGGQGGCERRIKVFVKIQKINWRVGGGRGRVGGVRVDVNEELNFLGKFKKKIGGGGGGVGSAGSGWGWGQGGCEQRIEVFGKIHKKKFRGGGLGGQGVRWGVSCWLGGQGGCERNVGGRG